MCLPSGESSTPTVIGLPQLSNRQKLWQIESAYHCSIIGTCLSVTELRQVASKFNLMAESNATDYELHGLFVQSAYLQTDSIRLINRLLEEKYSQTVKQFNNASTELEMAHLWNEAVDNGDVAGAFWAIIARYNVSDRLVQRVIGEVHMLSHLSGARCHGGSNLREEKMPTNNAYEINTQLAGERLRKQATEIVTLRAENKRQHRLILDLEELVAKSK
ncbi:MAG: hypothetical protein COA42_15985 [Alteromonadaceae bacterium]|nr:MAG: hypothetical protein COA42_15985 [Alteromonadaceae bacterium]